MLATGTLDPDSEDDVDDPGDGQPAPPLVAEEVRRRLVVPNEAAGERLDKVLARLIPSVSRSRIRQWIEGGTVRLNDRVPAVRAEVGAGDTIELAAPPSARARSFSPEPMALDIVHADESLFVLNKPPGLVVHPGAGNWSGTLLNGLLAHDPGLAGLPRAGIVHRLDAGTSGLMVVARTLAAHVHLVRQLQERSVTREYWAVVHGEAGSEGEIDAAIARDPRNPLRFKVSRAERAKPARTHYRRIEAVETMGRRLSWLACRLDTGRTHQIRVHLESIGLPLLGDPLYCRGRSAVGSSGDDDPLRGFARQALHACRLALVHPGSGEATTWFVGPPRDLLSLMTQLGFHPRRRVRAFDR